MSAQKDSPTKRGVPSRRPISLREAMGQSKKAGFGSPSIGPSKVNDKLKGGKGAGKGKSGKGGIQAKGGYDVKTTVNVGHGKGKK